MNSFFLVRESKIPPFQNQTAKRIMMTGILVSTIVLTLCSPGVAIEQTLQDCDENLLTIRVAVNGTVSVRCPNMTAQEMTFHLVLGKAQVAGYRVVQENSTRERVLPVQDAVVLRVSKYDHAVSFDMSPVQKEHTGLYTCEAWISYPPPSAKTPDAPKTLILVEEYPCAEKVVGREMSSISVPIAQESCSEKWWILVVLLAISISFGVVVTITSCGLWLRLRRVKQSHNNYVNMHVPMGPKRRGVQHPPPRRF